MALADGEPGGALRTLVQVRWRVGRSVGRTIYAHPDPEDDKGVLIGLMDTPELAEAAVDQHNLWLAHDC